MCEMKDLNLNLSSLKDDLCNYKFENRKTTNQFRKVWKLVFNG
jgi:hypothetical protein